VCVCVCVCVCCRSLSTLCCTRSTPSGADGCRNRGCTPCGWRGTRPSPTSPSIPKIQPTSFCTTRSCSASSTRVWYVPSRHRHRWSPAGPGSCGSGSPGQVSSLFQFSTSRKYQTQPGPVDPMRRHKDSGEEGELIMCDGEMEIHPYGEREKRREVLSVS